MIRIIVVTFFLVNTAAWALAQADSTVVLSFDNFMEIVKNEHPYTKQAEIKIYEGEASLLYAKGAFDPKIYTDVNQKYFKDDQYYSIINGGLKIPTWFGVELKGGYEQNQGIYLNSENTTPPSGLIYAGISLPVGRGLLIDKRRAELKKARLFQQVSEMERQIILNELLYMAGTTYWKWFKAYNTLQVYADGFRLANERFEAVKLGASVGDRPAIDTLEAGIQVQNRLLGLQQSAVEFKNATALLSIYLWSEGTIPLELDEGTVPVLVNSGTTLINTNKATYTQIDSLVNSHPSLNQSRYVINQLEIDKRLKRNQLLPVLNLKYNPITTNVVGELPGNFSINNYTWGMEFQMPLFLRKERGSLKLTNLKIEESNLKLSNKQQVLKYKVISAWNMWNATQVQIELYAQTVKDANNLLMGERQLFNIGESSLFMVNSREVGFIKTQLKFIELVAKNRNAELATMYSLGVLPN